MCCRRIHRILPLYINPLNRKYRSNISHLENVENIEHNFYYPYIRIFAMALFLRKYDVSRYAVIIL